MRYTNQRFTYYQ